MRQLNKYSYANARIRALLSFLLSPDLFERMIAAHDLGEVLSILKTTTYKEVVEKLPAEVSELLPLEKALLKDNLAACWKIYDAIIGKQEKMFIFLLIQRYELEEVKVALRIWHKKNPIDWNEYLLGETIAHQIDFSKIISSQNLDEIISILDSTPYKNPLMQAREQFQKKNSIFYLEIALDIDYYKRLLECAEKLSSTDQKVTKKILGVEIDIENIRWLLRQHKYYNNLNLDEMLEGVIPGGELITQEKVRSSYNSNGISNLINVLAIGPYSQVKNLVTGNVMLLERFLYEILFHEVHRVLSIFPFTMGVALGYLILKNQETKNIVSLSYAKYYKVEREEISSLIFQ